MRKMHFCHHMNGYIYKHISLNAMWNVDKEGKSFCEGWGGADSRPVLGAGARHCLDAISLNTLKSFMRQAAFLFPFTDKESEAWSGYASLEVTWLRNAQAQPRPPSCPLKDIRTDERGWEVAATIWDFTAELALKFLSAGL